MPNAAMCHAITMADRFGCGPAMVMAWVIIFTIKSWEVRSSSHRNWRESGRVGEALAIRAEGELAWPVGDDEVGGGEQAADWPQPQTTIDFEVWQPRQLRNPSGACAFWVLAASGQGIQGFGDGGRTCIGQRQVAALGRGEVAANVLPSG